MITRHRIQTSRRCELVDITAAVVEAVAASGCNGGLCAVYCPHTTGAVTINEGTDPDVAADILDQLDRMVPAGRHYRHTEGNADSHIKAALIGPGVSLPIEGGKPALGTWQRVFFCEFDGPRSRTVIITVIPGAPGG
jgi:secondary thiamine-phosphate synthase enzyme